MITDELAEKILDYAITHGGDYAEIFQEEKEYSKISLTRDEESSIQAGKEKGIGVRVLCGKESCYMATSNANEHELFQMLKSCLQNRNRDKNLCNVKVIQPIQIFKSVGAKEWSTREKIQNLEKCIEAGKNSGPNITGILASLLEDRQRVRIINTEGCNAKDERRKTRLFLKAFAEDGSERAESYLGPGIMGGPEIFDQIDVFELVEKTAASAEKMLHAKPCPTGKMPVVVANGFGGLLFHEACGHSLEASNMAADGSEFSGKIGKQIASEKVSLIDDGARPGAWGSLHIDDEGVPTRKNILIENGILKGCLVDRLDGRRLGMDPTGSARRENYRFSPVARMTNTWLLPGQDDPEEMIRSVQKGIYVKNIHAGSVISVTGEFNFYANETYLIENGKITCPVHGATLIGTGREILRKVEMVGADAAIGQGFCYASSGAIYIGAGQPTVKISEMTVGGNEVC